MKTVDVLGIVACIILGILLTAILTMVLTTSSIASDCEAFGAMKIDGTLYSCKVIRST